MLILSLCAHIRYFRMQGKQWVRAGGYVDFTSGTKATAGAIKEYLNAGNIDMKRVICSTDAYGSLPKFDAGVLDRYQHLV